jgi:hypothetical protein
LWGACKGACKNDNGHFFSELSCKDKGKEENMKNTMLLMSVLLLSTSCVGLDGRFHVYEAFTVEKKSGFFNQKISKALVEPSVYKVSLKPTGGNNYLLELKGGISGSMQIPITTDGDLNIPTDGKFRISAEKINQPFDISATVKTDILEYGYGITTESCLKGNKEISYHYKEFNRELSFEFMPAGSTRLIASFTGRNIETKKIIDRESSCR